MMKYVTNKAATQVNTAQQKKAATEAAAITENSILEQSAIGSEGGIDDKSLDISVQAVNLDSKDKEEALESRLVP
jgi:hypothetical protein